MSKTFTYSFSTPANSTLTIVTGDTTQAGGGPVSYTGFPIESISGTFNGETVTGLYGASGQYQSDSPSGDDQDNLIVSKDPAQQQPSTDGIDQFGISFTTQSGHLYTIENDVEGGFFYREYTSPSATTSSTGPVTLASTNYPTAVCFCSGTLIRVERDGHEMDVAVEDLAVGDLAVTASGAHRPIRWIGSRLTHCRRHPRPFEVMPVHITAYAFGENRPARDLVVSPGHSLCVEVVGEVLIPAASLINGTTIVQEDVDYVTYWHVELEGGHDIIIAENMPPRATLRWAIAPSSPKVPSSRSTPRLTYRSSPMPTSADRSMRRTLWSRWCVRSLPPAPRISAGHWVRTQSPGCISWSMAAGSSRASAGLSARFLMPAGAETVWLASDTAVPAQVGRGEDQRVLGVCIGQIVIDDGFASRTISADDPRLCTGFHDVEQGPQRWTAGRARLPSDLWGTCSDDFFLRVDMAHAALPRWIEPAKVAFMPEQLTFAS